MNISAPRPCSGSALAAAAADIDALAHTVCDALPPPLNAPTFASFKRHAGGAVFIDTTGRQELLYAGADS